MTSDARKPGEFGHRGPSDVLTPAPLPGGEGARIAEAASVYDSFNGIGACPAGSPASRHLKLLASKAYGRSPGFEGSVRAVHQHEANRHQAATPRVELDPNTKPILVQATRRNTKPIVPKAIFLKTEPKPRDHPTRRSQTRSESLLPVAPLVTFIANESRLTHNPGEIADDLPK